MNKKIFVSSSGIKIKDVEKNIKFLAKNGIKNIELSGGCTYSKNLTKKLISLKHRYNLDIVFCISYHSLFAKHKIHNLLI